jgi:hypothetical protein
MRELAPTSSDRLATSDLNFLGSSINIAGKYSRRRKEAHMAKKVTVTLVDDFDGKSQANETVQFSLDGVAYEIDLSTKNAGKLRGALEPWSEKARKTGRIKRNSHAKSGSTVGRDQSLAIREWAKKNGHKVSSRGRISAKLVAAYNGSN